MGILASCANGPGTSLMMTRNVEKAMKGLGVPTTKIHRRAISEGRSSANQYDVVFTSVDFLQMFQQTEKRRVTVIGIKNIISAKEIQEKYMASEHYQKSE